MFEQVLSGVATEPPQDSRRDRKAEAEQVAAPGCGCHHVPMEAEAGEGRF
jgi:hypothetical protein